MPIVQLSSQFAKDAACKQGKGKTDYYDSSISGFVLEARPSGGKTYHLRYRDGHGKLRQYKIGDATAISFEKARLAAQKLRSQVVLGENPIEERNTTRKIPILADFVQDVYLLDMEKHRRNYQSSISFLNHHVLPIFGGKHLDEITSQMVSDAHVALRTKGYSLAMANKLPIVIKTIYNLARKHHIPGVTVNPGEGVRLFVLNNARERFLTQEETQRLLDALDKSDNKQLKNIIALSLLFGCRKRELLDARWEDVDLLRRNWHIPMSKTGKSRNIPISTKALEILQHLPRWKDCPYVVANPKTKKPYGNLYGVWNTARVLAGLPDVRWHDLRHSFASNLVNAGQSIYVVGKLLGHTQVKTTARYSHLADATLLAAVDIAARTVEKGWGTASA